MYLKYHKVISINASLYDKLHGIFVNESVLENVVFDEHTREVDYTDKSVTGNRRCPSSTTYSLCFSKSLLNMDVFQKLNTGFSFSNSGFVLSLSFPLCHMSILFPHIDISHLFLFQRIHEQHILLSTFQTRRYHVLGHIRRMSFF